jgi:hypothetical protein
VNWTAAPLTRIALITLALCVGNGSVHADELTREKRADIERLLAMTGSLALSKQMANAVTAGMTQTLKQARPDIPEKVLDLMASEVSATFDDNMSSLKDEMIPLYHRHFSASEIKGLVNFYSTELGQKTIKVMPVLMQEGMQVGQRWGQSLAPKIKQRVSARLQQQGIKL